MRYGLLWWSLPLLLSQSIRAQSTPMEALDHPMLSAVESAVREDIEAARLDVRALFESGDGGARLGRAWGELGELYLVYDYTAAAADCLQQAEYLLPDEFRWPYLLGTLWEHERELEAALAAYRRSVALEPAYLPTRLRIAEMLFLQGEVEAARTGFEAALRSDSESAFAWAGLGRVAERQGAFESVVSHLRRALELQPEATSLHYPLALAYRRLGDEEAAANHLAQRGQTRVRFFDPLTHEVREKASGAGASFIVASRDFKDGNAAAAEARLREAVAASPASPQAWAGLGAVLAAEGRWDEGIEAFRRAVDLEPDSTRRRSSLADMLVQAGRDVDAIPEMQAVLARAPDFATMRLRLSEALARLGRSEEAVDELSRVLDASPGQATLHWRRALLLEGLGRASDAVADLEAVIAVAPDDAEAHFKLGTLLETEPERAIGEFQAAVTIDPTLGAAHRNLAILLGRQGRVAEAAEHQARVVALDPQDRGAALYLALIRILAGDWPEVRRGLEVALALHPDDARIADLLARVLVASPVVAVRDAATGLEIAAKVFDAYPTVEHGETLAMALGAAGRFEEAVAVQRGVVEQRDAAGSPPAAAVARARLDAYVDGREAPSPWVQR